MDVNSSVDNNIQAEKNKLKGIHALGLLAVEAEAERQSQSQDKEAMVEVSDDKATD